jgi:Histidine kinase-, DNA gyrase B-, and HSP90-like ATPase
MPAPDLLKQPYDHLPPEAESTFEGHRAFGYGTATALADLVDNSITAGAKHIWIDFEWDGPSSTITTTDDGDGMSECELIAAMRLSSRNPREQRAENDLGRFGLGLKTASLSQCRRFTVRTRRRGSQTATRCWDLAVIKAAKDWRLLRAGDIAAETSFQRHAKLSKGTAVVWQNIDRLTDGTHTDNESDHQHFLRRIEEVRGHLGLVFHRMLRSKRAGSGVSLLINDREVEPWDPYLENEPATHALAATSLSFAGAKVRVHPFVLPHLSKLPKPLHELAAGPHGWNGHQGFYIYRNKRLLVAGDWLGFWPKQDLYRLARIRVDLPNCLDDHWQIDVTKSRAIPPPTLRVELRRIGEKTRSEARRIYTYRGAKLTPRAEVERTFLWEPRARHDKTFYRLNRDHPLIRRVVATTMDKSTLRALLCLIEETIPLHHITVENNEKPDNQPQPFEGSEMQVREVMETVHRSLCESGLSSREVLNRLRTLWPFELFPELLQTFEEKLIHE